MHSRATSTASRSAIVQAQHAPGRVNMIPGSGRTHWLAHTGTGSMTTYRPPARSFFVKVEGGKSAGFPWPDGFVRTA
eukprot:26104-Prymnesium_polylepis.1